VLVIDDDARGRRLLVAMVEAAGHLALEAGDGAQALEMARQNPPDAILLDILMPGADGYAVARALKEDPLTRPIPIMMVTALSDRESRLRGLEAGAEEFVSKPVDRLELGARLRNLVKLKRYGDELLRRTEETNVLLSHLPDAVIEIDSCSMVRKANAAAQRIFGYTPEELVGCDVNRLMPEPVRSEHLSHVGRYLRSGDSNIIGVSREVTGLHKDGRLLSLELRIAEYRAHGERYFIGILRDIAERKRIEHERDSGLRRIVSLMRHAGDWIFIFDADDRIIDVSDSCQAAYGYTRQEFFGLRFPELCTPASRAACKSTFDRLRVARSLSYQATHCRKDGVEFAVHVGATMIEVDEARYFQAIVHDISESERHRLAMERQLAIASNRLGELSRHLVEAQEDARRRLSGELHDRTSPNLAAIQVNLGILTAALPSSIGDDLVTRMEDIRALIEDTDTSIREVCADLRSPVLDYAGLREAMVRYAEVYSKRSGVVVTVDCVNGYQRVKPALESLLFRIFQEALTNTLKHAKASAVAVALDTRASSVALTISDDGVGFDPDRVGAVPSKPGMGLLNMGEMAELAGGRMVLSSGPGRGTRIEVRIQA